MIFLYGLLILLAGMLLRTLCVREPKSVVSQKVPPLSFDTEAAITHLSEAIQCQTISEIAGEITHPEAFKQLHALLEKAYPLVFERLEKEVLGEFSLLFKWPGKNPDLKPVLCIAHQDVVPVPEKEIPHWTEPPFSGNVSDGYIWGRGALDMKSSLMALFEAINQLLISGFEPKRTIYLYSGDDEEVGGPTAEKAAEHLKEAGVQFSFIIDEGGAIVDEMVPHVDAPLGLIGIGQKGVLTLELSVDGESGHSAQPTQKTPIDVLGGAVAKLKKNEMPVHSQALVFKMFKRLAPCMPFKSRFIFSNLWLFKKLLISQLVQRPLMNAMMRTTGVPTIFNAGLKQNIVPETASVTLNYRLYPGDTKQTVLKHVNRLIKGTDITIKVINDFNAPFVSRTDTFGFDVIHQTARSVCEDELFVAPVLTVGTTDARHFEHLTDATYQFLFIRGTMEDFKGYHGMNERISIKNFLNNIHFYYYLLQNTQKNIK